MENWILAHDLTPSSDGAADEVARLTSLLKGQLTIVYVDDGNHASSEEKELRASVARARLDRLAVILRERYPVADITVRVVRGDPVQSILGMVKELRAHAVAVGTGGRSADPLAARLLKVSQVPTLVVPER